MRKLKIAIKLHQATSCRSQSLRGSSQGHTGLIQERRQKSFLNLLWNMISEQAVHQPSEARCERSVAERRMQRSFTFLATTLAAKELQIEYPDVGVLNPYSHNRHEFHLWQQGIRKPSGIHLPFHAQKYRTKFF